MSDIYNLGIYVARLASDGGDSIRVNMIVLVALGVACAVIGYLLGGINTSIIVSRAFYHDDIRKYGSHNAGMTNAMRTYGKKAAVLTLGGDLLKTVIAVMLSRLLLGEPGAYIGGFFTVVGHVFPCFFGFKGGKGVVAVAAMILCTNPLCFLILFAIFAVLVLGYKYISLGSVMCMLLYPLLANRLGVHGVVQTSCIFLTSFLIIIKHFDNIKRLLNGTESKFSFKKSKPATEASVTAGGTGDAGVADDTGAETTTPNVKKDKANGGKKSKK